MFYAFMAFVISLVINFIFMYLSRKVTIFSDHSEGVQKFHTVPTPRVGGVGIYIAFLVGLYIYDFSLANKIILITLPVFLAGLIEDLYAKVSPKIRLFAAVISAILAIYLMNSTINRVDIAFADDLLSIAFISWVISIFAYAGLTNAINIIDGFNGLAAVVSIMILLGLAYLGYKVHDNIVINISFLLISSILGFFIWNYPFGKIFLGDGGAYFIGFIIAFLSIYIIHYHKEISPWAILLLSIYPVFETLFSIYRKKFLRGISPMYPDGVHLHMLIYKRLVPQMFGINRNEFHANSATSPFLWLIASLGFFPAIFFYDNSKMAIIFIGIFACIYILLYKKLVKFQLFR